MMYADSFCTYEEKIINGEQIYRFLGPCYRCKVGIEVLVPGPDLYQYRQGKSIQEAFPTLGRDECEFLMSGICGVCWKELFNEDE